MSHKIMNNIWDKEQELQGVCFVLRTGHQF